MFNLIYVLFKYLLLLIKYSIMLLHFSFLLKELKFDNEFSFIAKLYQLIIKRINIKFMIY